MEYVVLVDENDREIGIEEKIKAHENGGKLHRAFSIFIFNKNGKMLLQRRALTKYHAPGLWSNTCCSHPRPGEEVEKAAHRRLREEMGFDCELKWLFATIYKADVGNGLTEWEYDHVFIGTFDGEPEPNPEEVCEWKWISIEELVEDVKKKPEKYTPWFRILLPKVLDFINLQK